METSRKASLFEVTTTEGMMYVVTFGMGKKIPEDNHKNISDKGGVIVKGSVWRYIVHEGMSAAKVRADAEILYNKNC